MSVVLYDAEKGEEQGWLVSMLSAILHMAHVCANQVKTELERPIRHAINHWDGGKSAYDVFREHSGVFLERNLVERTEYRLKDLVIRSGASSTTDLRSRGLPGRLLQGDLC